MRSTLLIASAVTAMVVSAETAFAQRSSSITIDRGSFAITPYGGYLINQKLFDGPLSTSLTVTSAPLYGVQFSLPLAPSASLIGGVAQASGDLEAGLPIIGGVSVGTTSTTVFDASVELRLESKRYIPVVQLGGGAIRREATVAGMTAKTTDFQVSGGVGVDVPIASNFAVRIMAKDYYGKADFGSLGPLSARTEDLHAIALMGGVRIAF